MFAALCHDFGKPVTTAMIDGRWRARGHSEAGEKPARNFLERIGAPSRVIDEVIPLIKEHLTYAGVKTPTTRAVQRLANRLGSTSIQALNRLVEADHAGRPPLPPKNPFSGWMRVAQELNVATSRPDQILKGRHLIDLGISPGREMGRMLKTAFQAQLDGVFDNENDAISWAQNNLI